MEIRQLTISDYERLYSLWISCKGMGLNNLDDSKEGIKTFLENNPTTSLCAEEDGNLIGAIMIGTDGRRGYIYHTAVSPEYRLKGIGKKLVEAAMAETEKLGISKVALVVFSRNEDGNRFWEKMGFFTRNDIIYKDRIIKDMIRMDT